MEDMDHQGHATNLCAGFLEDTGLENITELISVIEDRNLWKSIGLLFTDMIMMVDHVGL